MNDPATFPTGSPALDRVLGGGLPAASTTLVAGLPGTGKTVLAEQFLFANASEAAPALYLTTLSEPLAKTVRYLQGFTFFDPARLPGAIHYRDIGQPIRAEGIGALPRLVEDLVVERGAAFLVIDSFKALHDLSSDPLAFRTSLFDLGRVLTAAGVTALLLGEYSASEIAVLPEFAVADGVVELSNRSYGARDERVLRVHKLRGAAHLLGEHSFRIDADGLKVFPRLVGTEVERATLAVERFPTRVPGLDPLLHGGLWRGSATIVAGPTGVGKTMLGLRYLLTGAEAGEPGLLLSFQESPAHLRRIITGFGADLEGLERDGLLRLAYVSPLELDLVELFDQVRALLEQGQMRRLVVDSLGDVKEAAIERGRFRAMLWSLIQYLALHGVTALLLLETPIQAEAADFLTRDDVSYMADNIVLLRYVRPPRDGFDRDVEVLKTRGSGHDPTPRPYRVGRRGLEIVAASPDEG